MLSTIIISPKDGETVDASKNFSVTLDVANMVTGFFSDANKDYYLAPQTIVGNGNVEGHQHVTIQKIAGNGALDPTVFAFFKGINDAATDGQGRSLAATVAANSIKESGAYRICTITGSDTHQPVLSPVVQRGPQDDCIRVNIDASKVQAAADPAAKGAGGAAAKNGGAAKNNGAAKKGAKNAGAKKANNAGAKKANNGGAKKANNGAKKGGAVKKANTGAKKNTGAKNAGAKNAGAKNAGAKNAGAKKNTGAKKAKKA
ncbi:hypothetical protein EDD86DRAFT_214735 [Gorgonomyces haynaldii]|nr:hypothetical protein EDD86DRAFT_214735 [Gorgonomyces haynaldii]